MQEMGIFCVIRHGPSRVQDEAGEKRAIDLPTQKFCGFFFQTMVHKFNFMCQALRSPLMVDGACKISSINQSINQALKSIMYGYISPPIKIVW